MLNILSRCKSALVVTVLLYVQAFVYCSFEFLNVSFGALPMDTGLIFVGLMLITTYFYIMCLPTTIVPKITSIRLLLIVIVTLLVSVYIDSTRLVNYIVENIILTISFIWIVLRLKKCFKKVKKANINDYVFQSFKLYKLHELNIINCLLYVCFTGALAILGLTLTTVCYAIAIVAILLVNNYIRMTRANLTFGNLKWYIVESIGVVLSIIYILIAGYLEWRIWLKAIAFIPAALYAYTTYKLWREYRSILK